MKPTIKPGNPCFSSGPCAKRPGWDVSALKNAANGRSHRAKIGKQKLEDVINLSKEILGIPENYQVGIVPASDTGAVEMFLWSALGARPVDMLAWESFGQEWVTDVTKQLKINANVHKADYGKLPDLTKVNQDNDVVFTWNGTTSGVKVPNGDWIKSDRQGLTICDATSAVFAMDLPWEKLDVVTWSWQKAMGGEGAHGMLVLSPRAVERLETYNPDRPLPKIFRLTKGGKLIEGIFKGETINTPSMLAVEDALDSLNWIKSIGGFPAFKKRSEENFKALESWVDSTPWIEFLAEDRKSASNTSVCFKIVDSAYTSLSPEEQEAKAKDIVKLLDSEKAAYDIGAYRDAPAGLRIWAGGTVETSDIKALIPWLNWAFAEVMGKAKAA